MIVLMYGVPGARKTTALHYYVESHPAHRFFVVDHADEWGAGSGMWLQGPLVTLVGKTPPEEWAPAGIYVFRDWESRDVAQLAVDVGNVVFVDDEIDFVARKVGWEDNPLRYAVHRGRHLENASGQICELHVLGAARRPQNLATDLSELATEVFIFRVQGSRTFERLVADGHCDPEDIDTIRDLADGHYLHWPSHTYGCLVGSE